MGRRRAFDEEEVLDQALDLFWSRGYRSATPAALVTATGLSKSSLYATFESKDSLFLRVLQRYIDEQVRALGSLLDAPTLSEGLWRMYESLIELGTGGRTCLVCSSTIEGPLGETDVQALVQQGHASIESLLLQRLVRAREEGELDASRDLTDTARFLLATNMGLMVLARANPDPEAMRAIAREAIRAVC